MYRFFIVGENDRVFSGKSTCTGSTGWAPIRVPEHPDYFLGAQFKSAALAGAVRGMIGGEVIAVDFAANWDFARLEERPS